jgi:FAD:protein FMN transferase
VNRPPILWTSVIVCLGLAGCRTAPKPEAPARYEFSQPHMGTLWRITLYAPDAEAASNAVQAAFARVAGLDRMMTDYDPDSELMRLSKSRPGQPFRVSEELFDILRRSQEIARSSGGAFDVTLGPAVQLWRRARRQRELPAPERLAASRQAVGFEKLRLDSGQQTATLLADKMRLDLGGIAKGYAADAALRVLRGRGLPRALVAASGDLAIGEPPPGKAGWRVGIGRPRGAATNLATILLLRNAGVSTSGDAEQYVELDGVRYSHIVNPRTGWALTNTLQVTIVADCATRSDAFATTVCVLGPEAGLAWIEGRSRCAALVLAPGSEANPPCLKSRRFVALEKHRGVR